MKPILFSITLTFLTWAQAFGQDIAVEESSLDFTIVKWHYTYYPKSVTESWILTADQKGNQVFRVRFSFEGYGYEVTYTPDGARIDEIQFLEKNIPVSISHMVEDNYAKPKIRSFQRFSDFKNEEVSFEMEIRTKDKGDLKLFFDESLILQEEIAQ